MARPVAGQHVRSVVEKAARALEAHIAQDADGGQSWRDYLRLSDLDAQLSRGASADAEEVAKIAERFTGLEVAPSEERLAAVHDAVQKWSADLTDRRAALAAQQQVSDLRRWTRRSRRIGGWTGFFSLDELSSETRKRSDIDEPFVAKVVDRLQWRPSFADLSTLIQTQRALEHWLAELENPVMDPLALAARNAKRPFRDVPEMRRQEPRVQLKNAVNRLDNFLQSGGVKKETGWKRFLRWESLERELGETVEPSSAALREIHDQFSKNADGLDRVPFIRAQRALDDYIGLLELRDSQPARLVDELNQLRDESVRFDRYLAAGGATKEQGWKRFLGWEDFAETLAQPDPDVRILAQTGRYLERDQPGLERARFRQLRRRIMRYMEVYQYSRRATADDILVTRLENLTRALAERRSPDPDIHARITAELQWLAVSGQDPGLVSRVEADLRRPNVHVRAAERLIVDQVSDVVTERSPIGRCFEGAWISGTANTRAHISAELIPSPNSVVMDILLQGTTATNSVGTQRRVNVFTTGTTWTSGRKRLTFDMSGLSAAPAQANSSTDQQINGVRVNRRFGRRLISRAACRRAYEKKPRAEAVANQDASGQIRENMDQQARELVANANDAFQLRVVKPLEKNELYPQMVNVSSTSDAVLIDALAAPEDALGPATPSPPLPTSHDLALSVHQTAVNNLIAKYVGNVTLNNEQMMGLLDSYNLQLPGGPQQDADDDEDQDEDDEPWSITFDRHQPATVSFDQGHVKLSIVGTRFTRGNDVINERIRIGGTYQMAWTSDGKFELTRVGDVDVEYLDIEETLTSELLAYKTFLRKKVEPMFLPHVGTDDLPENEATRRLKALKIETLTSARGWLTTGLHVDTDQLGDFGLKPLTGSTSP
ncbi:MAG: hypothetical protein KDA60_09695 [Planctomycetales bacterium]|nr:hypothetical protein [Planctomycetales bacterium]